ncbi:MAG: SDR family NAD(P)-dependent oxidoreductase, partial [Patescibacteria group bacterium]
MKIAINGFGRIGRVFFRQAFDAPDIEIVGINDLGDITALAYLLRYDTVYGRYDKTVEVRGEKLAVEGKEIVITKEKDPAKLPWGDLQVDVVVESTGVFTTTEKAKAHLDAGAKRVVISAPAKDEETPTATPNVGMQFLEHGKVTSNASCTTNAATPVIAIMMKNPGIQKGLLSTVHGYTATQSLVDGPVDKDLRRGRAAAQNIVPSSTGAAEAVERAIPEMKKRGGGRVINITISSAKQPGAGSMPTSMSRAAGLVLTKSLSKEYAPDNILVNTVCIGKIKSGQHERRMVREGRSPEK